MDVSTFCRQSHVLIVAGKGGVGKTTMVAALAHLAAGAGLSVLVIELEGRAGIATHGAKAGGIGPNPGSTPCIHRGRRVPSQTEGRTEGGVGEWSS